ncbi:MAG TPA: hypothetical protein VK050_11365 [Flavobacteriaceae bacterium]|nr:hypothetical protein [Flavobacteriaceae bacterium]
MFRRRKKNKEFRYQARYYKSRRDAGPFKIEYKFDEYRTTVGSNRGLKNKFKAAIADFKESRGTSTNKIILIIALILVLIFLYIIDFDLSIFLQPL